MVPLYTLLDELRDLAGALRNVRICHIDSTAAGGGVAELLWREVPLLEDLGLHVHWRIIRGEKEFFDDLRLIGNLIGVTRGEPSSESLALHDPVSSAEICLSPSACQFARHGTCTRR